MELQMRKVDTGYVISANKDGMERDVAICYNGVGKTHIFDTETFYDPANRENLYAILTSAMNAANHEPVRLEPCSVALMDAYELMLSQMKEAQQQLFDRIKAHHGIECADCYLASGKLVNENGKPVLYYEGSIPLTQRTAGTNVYLFPCREDEIGEDYQALDLDYGTNHEEHRLFCFLPASNAL